MIFVANAREFIKDGRLELPENAVYVGRRIVRYGLGTSPLANYFFIGKSKSELGFTYSQIERKKSIEFYHEYLLYALRNPLDYKLIVEEFNRLKKMANRGDLILVCWCAPKACHADVIKNLLEK